MPRLRRGGADVTVRVSLEPEAPKASTGGAGKRDAAAPASRPAAKPQKKYDATGASRNDDVAAAPRVR